MAFYKHPGQPTLLAKPQSLRVVRQQPTGALTEGVAMSETVGRPESLISSDTESIPKEHTWPRGLRPNLKVTALGTVLVPLGLFLLSVVNGKAADDGSEPGQAGLIYPVMVKYLIGIQGFNADVRYTALSTVATSIFAFLVVQPSPAHQFRKPPQGWTSLSTWIDVDAMRNPTFVWYMVSISFMFFGFFAVFFSLEEWAAVKGFGLKKSPTLPALPSEQPKDAIRTFWLLSIANACSTLGRLASAYLADALGALSIHLVFTASGSLLCLCLWTLARTFAAAIAFAVLFGAVSGAIIALPAAGVAEILGPTREAQAKLGQWTGMVFSASAAFTLTGPVVAGHLVSRYGSWLAVQLWAGLCLAVASLCMVGSRVCMARQRKRADTDEKRLSQATTEERVEEVVDGNDATEDGR
ncbi:MAG: hypothetical protein Q9165_005277 [Trypethelium subeluteriae]